MMDDEFDMFNLFGEPDRDHESELRERIERFQSKVRDEAMREAYRFIDEVGILFWIRRDMYIQKSRKKSILNKMILYFQELEEYEKCAYLLKGIKALEESTTENNLSNI